MNNFFSVVTGYEDMTEQPKKKSTRCIFCELKSIISPALCRPEFSLPNNVVKVTHEFK